MLQNSCGVEDKVRFAVECGSERKKGIHIRNWKADKPMDVSVAVEPVMLNDTEAGEYWGVIGKEGIKLGYGTAVLNLSATYDLEWRGRKHVEVPVRDTVGVKGK